VKLAGQDTYVAFVGGGPTASGDDPAGKAMFVVDVATGVKLWEYAHVPGASDDRRHMTFGLSAAPTAVDADNDGYVDRVYSGDAGGQMWKFDVTAAETSGWKGKRVFSPTMGDDASSRSGGIDIAPALTMDRHRNIWLHFGTAREAANTPAPGRFYALRDDDDMSNDAALTDASASIRDVTAGAPPGSRGWYVLLGRGENVVGAPNVFNGTVLFTTFTPDGAGCGAAGGTARLYALRAWNGQAAIDFTTGSALGTPIPTSRRSKEIGRGSASVPLVIIARPPVPGTPAAAFVMTSTANREVFTTAIPAPAFLKHVKSWRERVQ
jgi:type IV pilus assembly protein PilY1